MNTELQTFYETIALASNTTTLFVNFIKLRIRFPTQSVKSALDQTADIERIVDTLFYKKQVMWEHFSFEDKNWCMRSLIDLREKCDHEVEVFLGRQTSINDKDHFVASLLRTLGSYSDEAYKDIVKSNI